MKILKTKLNGVLKIKLDAFKDFNFKWPKIIKPILSKRDK